MHNRTLTMALALLPLVSACDEGEGVEDADYMLVEDDALVVDQITYDDHAVPTMGGMVPALEEVVAFNSAAFETPESVAVLSNNDLVVSMALTGELRKVAKDGTQSTLAFIPLGPPELCQGPFPGIMGALAVDPFDNVYVGANACDLSNKGVWRVSPQGAATKIASAPPQALLNGIAYRAGYLYLADSGSTNIWRAPAFGDGSPAEVWTDEPLLADPNPFDVVPGANGLQFFDGSMFVANAGAGTIVEIPFEPGGLFGTDLQAEPGFVKYGPASTSPEHETPADFPGCDDFAFDLVGRIYCTTDPFQTVVRLSPLSVDVLWTAEDGLDGPSAAVFGRGLDWKTLYVSNAQFPFFPPTGNGPSVLKATLPIGGYPFR